MRVCRSHPASAARRTPVAREPACRGALAGPLVVALTGLSLLLPLAGCGKSTKPAGPARRATPAAEPSAKGQRCGAYKRPVRRGTLPPMIDEASGLVVSAADPNVLWTHNDGAEGRLYAVNAVTGKRVATLSFGLPQPPDADWEDLSAGPCGGALKGKRCLYIADIGNNERARKVVRVHRLVEPDPRKGDLRVRALETMAVRFPKRAHNSEALTVDPAGVVWILTKSKRTIRVMRAPFRAGSATWEQVAKLDGEAVLLSPKGKAVTGHGALVTGMDYDPQLGRVAVRTYKAVWEVCVGKLGVAGLAKRRWHRVSKPKEKQGESVAYGPGGLWHVSEGMAKVISFEARR